MWRGLYNFLTDPSVLDGVPAGRFFASRVLRASKLSSFFTIPRSGYKLRFYPSAVSTRLWSDPAFGAGDEAVLRRILRPGDVFVDVGANVGHLTLAGSNIVGPNGLVFSLEAHPRTARYLRGNVAFNQAHNVHIIPAAAGEKDGITHFTNQRSDDLNFVIDHGIEVRVLALDSVIPQVTVRLLKVDVEGGELMVFKGATETLARTEFVYFESDERLSVRFGYSTGDVFDRLRAHGFKNLPREPSAKPENILTSR